MFPPRYFTEWSSTQPLTAAGKRQSFGVTSGCANGENKIGFLQAVSSLFYYLFTPVSNKRGLDLKK